MVDPKKPAPSHWRERAQEARAIADHMRNAENKAAMLKIADEYEEAAVRFDVEEDGDE